MLSGWVHSGFNIHLSRRIAPNECQDLQRLAQYIVRNPFSVANIFCGEDAGKDPLVIETPAREQKWSKGWLDSRVFMSDGLGATNTSGAVGMMLVDLSAYLNFCTPLEVRLDTESLLAQNQTIIHATYRCSGTLLEPTAGWAIETA